MGKELIEKIESKMGRNPNNFAEFTFDNLDRTLANLFFPTNKMNDKQKNLLLDEKLLT
ncbi:MAG: hypothetical protein U9P79_01725 [Candidatus Cloacimonadota bacterium]|nr:hypothetical protein [Candidatus Cloacimonadota bacterium]